MPQNVKGTFTSTRSTAASKRSDVLQIPTGVTSIKLNITGLDANNTVRTQKSTNNGGNWVNQTTYSSNQTNTAVTVAHGEQWRLFAISMQAGKNIDYSLSAES